MRHRIGWLPCQRKGNGRGAREVRSRPVDRHTPNLLETEPETLDQSPPAHMEFLISLHQSVSPGASLAERGKEVHGRGCTNDSLVVQRSSLDSLGRRVRSRGELGTIKLFKNFL